MGLVVGGREGGFYKGNAPPLIMRARNGVHLLFLPDSWSLRGRSTLVYARYMDTLHARRPWRERNWKGAPRPARRTPAPTRRRPSRSQPAWRPGWRPARQRLRAPRGLGLLPILCFFSNDICVEFACSNRRRPCITQAVKIRDAGREGKSPAACPPVDVLASARLSVGGIRCLGITSDRWLLRMRMLSRGQSTLRAAFGCAWRLGVDAMFILGKRWKELGLAHRADLGESIQPRKRSSITEVQQLQLPREDQSAAWSWLPHEAAAAGGDASMRAARGRAEGWLPIVLVWRAFPGM